MILKARRRKQAVLYNWPANQLRESAVSSPKVQINPIVSTKKFQSTTITEESRKFDLLFLASHKEKPSPSGATVSLLL